MMRTTVSGIALGACTLLSARASLAVTGCMEPVESLVRRAELVVLGEVLELKTSPRNCSDDQPLIPTCRSLESITLRAEAYLVGDGPQRLTVHVPPTILRLSCDDPYTLEGGDRVALFLRLEGGRHVTVGDEGSVYPLERATEESIRLALKLMKCELAIQISRDAPRAGDRVTVIHNLHNGGSTSIHPCIARPSWYLRGSEASHQFRGWQDEYVEPECFPAVRPGESATWVHKLPLVDVGPGAASLHATLELFDRLRCESSPCVTSLLSSESLHFQFEELGPEGKSSGRGQRTSDPNSGGS